MVQIYCHVTGIFSDMAIDFSKYTVLLDRSTIEFYYVDLYILLSRKTKYVNNYGIEYLPV